MVAPWAAVVGDRVRAALQSHISDAVSSTASSPPRRVLARAWEGLARPARPVVLPDRCVVIGVAGATLGGSGVTSTALAVARAAARRQARVSVVSHGYRGRVRGPRWVRPDDAPSLVGDEALELTRALAPDGIGVAVGASRVRTIAFAASTADVIVVDGLLQATPKRLGLGLLVLEAEEPWGLGACPPVGNLRAPSERLLACADAVVWLSPVAAAGGGAPSFESRPAYATHSSLCIRDGVGRPASIESLRGARCGLVVGVARPGRIGAALERLGIRLAVEIRLADHASAGTFHAYELRAPKTGIDLWLTTAKCATKIGVRFAGAPVFTVSRDLVLPPALEHRLEALSS